MGVRFYSLVLVFLIPLFGWSQGFFPYPKWLPAPDSLHVFPTPVFYRTPENGVAYGLGTLYRFDPISYTDSTKKRFSTVYLSLIHTTKKQTLLELNHHLLFAKGKVFLRGNFNVEDFYDKYYGIGGNQKESALETFRFQRTFCFQQAQWQYRKNAYLGVIGWYYDLRNISVISGNGTLSNRTAPGAEGSRNFAMGFNSTIDTRDHQFVHSKGWFWEVQLLHAANNEFNTHPFTRVRTDLRWASPIFNEKTVLASQLYLDQVSSGAAFQFIPSLGGDRILRGYFRGRYRDLAYAATQVEIRHTFKNQFGFQAFASAGQVGPTWKQFGESPWKFAGGAGIRYKVSEGSRTIVRLDYAINREGGSGWYLRVNEAF
ncbi:MAG: BamA/TamA family outer membrane protein [Bacteroidia bacterium]